MTSKRIEHIDIAKGISIILVAMYHSHLLEHFPNVIQAMSVFRMPLFFFLSGVFFSTKLSFALFSMKKADALMKPYFIVGFVVVIYYVFVHGYPIKFFSGVLYGDGDTLIWVPMWFLTHLFAVYCLSYLLFKLLPLEKLEPKYSIILFLILFSFGYMIMNMVSSAGLGHLDGFGFVGLPFSLDIIFMTSAYFILGRLNRNAVVNFKPNYIVFIVCLSIFILLNVSSELRLDFNKRYIENPAFSLIGSLIGIYLVMTVSFVLSKVSFIHRSINYVGQSSLYILIFHFTLIANCYPQLVKYFGAYIPDVILAIASLVFGIIAPLFIRIAIESNRYSKRIFRPVSA